MALPELTPSTLRLLDKLAEAADSVTPCACGCVPGLRREAMAKVLAMAFPSPPPPETMSCPTCEGHPETMPDCFTCEGQGRVRA